MTARRSASVRKRTELRRELHAERRKRSKGPRRHSVKSFASSHSLRLDMHPASVIDHRRVASVLDVVRRSGVAPYLERRLRSHPGRTCSYAPEMLCVGTILSILNGWTLELTDVTRALAAIPSITRARLGLRDADGYFIGYRSVDHQFNRLTQALDEGWDDDDGTHCDLQWLIDALIKASIPDDAAPVQAVALDGMAVESFSYMRWPRSLDRSLLDALIDDPTPVPSAESMGSGDDDDVVPGDDNRKHLTVAERAVLEKKAKHPWPEAIVDRRPVPSKDPDARQGHRTVTNAQQLEFYLGYELHLASSVKSATWLGDPREIQFGPDVSRYVTGMRLSRAGAYRGDPGIDLARAMRSAHPELRELIADLGYTNLTETPFNDLVRSMGLDVVMNVHPSNLKTAVGKDIPLGRFGSKGTQKVVSAVGSLFHEYMPARYFDNPTLPSIRNERRREVEDYYNERAAYLWRHHSYGPDGTIRLQCPACAGRLRPLDLTRAARAGVLDYPELEAPAGATACCTQSIITTNAEQRGWLYQSPPLFTTAWARSYRRRLISETSNSVLRSGLARMVRGFFRVFTLPKVGFLIGMALVALNIKTAEQEWQADHVEVIDEADPELVDTAEVSIYSAPQSDGGDEVEAVATPPPEP